MRNCELQPVLVWCADLWAFMRLHNCKCMCHKINICASANAWNICECVSFCNESSCVFCARCALVHVFTAHATAHAFTKCELCMLWQCMHICFPCNLRNCASTRAVKHNAALVMRACLLCMWMCAVRAPYVFVHMQTNTMSSCLCGCSYVSAYTTVHWHMHAYFILIVCAQMSVTPTCLQTFLE